MAIYSLSAGPIADIESDEALSLDFLDSRTIRNQFLLFTGYLVGGNLLYQLKWTHVKRRYNLTWNWHHTLTAERELSFLEEDQEIPFQDHLEKRCGIYCYRKNQEGRENPSPAAHADLDEPAKKSKTKDFPEHGACSSEVKYLFIIYYALTLIPSTDKETESL